MVVGKLELLDLLDGIGKACCVHHPIVDVGKIRTKWSGAAEDAAGVQVAPNAAEGNVGDKSVAEGRRHARGGWVGWSWCRGSGARMLRPYHGP